MVEWNGEIVNGIGKFFGFLLYMQNVQPPGWCEVGVVSFMRHVHAIVLGVVRLTNRSVRPSNTAHWLVSHEVAKNGT